MATQPNTTPAAATPAKVKDVLNDMDDRRILPNVEEATAYINKCIADFPDLGNYPFAAPGVDQDEEGNMVFDPAIYTDETRVMVSVLTQRGDGPNTSSVKAIVIAPVPTMDSILGSVEGKAWADKILAKELNHVAVRQLRKATDVADVIDSMPKTLADYITSNRESGGILAAFEELWRPIKNNMAKLSRAWKLANLSKKELRRGLESSAYAAEYYPTLEESKQGSLFVFALNGLITTAKKNGLDPTIFERWLENRDEKTIDVEAEDEAEEFSLDDLTAAMESPETAAPANDEAVEPTPEGEPAVESEAVEEEATEENTAPAA